MKELRRVHQKWWCKDKAKIKARISRGKYLCATCGQLYGPREIALDHISPVINPETGFIDWNTYIKRLFIEESGYQVLCKACHTLKTNEENIIRREQK